MRSATRFGIVWLGLGLCLIGGGGTARGAGDDDSSGTAFAKTGCIVQARRTVVVGSQASGVIVRMPVEEQDTVRTGQLIAQLDDRIATLVVERLRLAVAEDHAIDEAQIRLDQARDDFETAKKLKGRISEAEYRSTERKFKLAQVVLNSAKLQKALSKIELQQAEKRLSERRVLAPIDGIVLTKHREVGESVDDDSHTPVVTLIDVSRLRAELLLPVGRIVDIRLGQRATVVCDVFPDRTIEGKVVFIEPVIHPEVDEFRVKVEFTDPTPDADSRVRPGMKATVKILKGA